jgi:biotin carboxyl carrier protein
MMNRVLSIIRYSLRKLIGVQVLPPKGSPQRLVVVVSLALFLTVVFPFAFWFLTWHGWALDPAHVETGLGEPLRPARASQQIMQIGEKLSRGDHSVRRWYPRIVELAKTQDEDLRRNVAWMMGRDPEHESFREVLRTMLNDPLPMVRLEAALSLAQFRDATARQELQSATQPFRVNSSVAGRIQMRIDTGDTTRPQTVVARINDVDVIASVPGKVTKLLAKDGEDVTKGQSLVAIERNPTHIEQARRALRVLDHP